jgi:hypothetical protein
MRFLIVFALILSGGSVFGKTQDLDDLTLRPSYKKISDDCRANISDFKVNYYEQAYLSGYYETLQAIAFFSPQAISTMLAQMGITTFAYSVVNNETTYPALVDCMHSEKKAASFLRNILLVEGTGKAVAVTTTVLGGKMLGAIFQKTYSSLARLSPILAKRLMVTTVVASSSYSIYIVKKDFEKRKLARNEASSKTPDIESDYYQKITEQADKYISQIQEVLKDPSLSPGQVESLERELHNWELILRNFKHHQENNS